MITIYASYYSDDWEKLKYFDCYDCDHEWQANHIERKLKERAEKNNLKMKIKRTEVSK